MDETEDSPSLHSVTKTKRNHTSPSKTMFHNPGAREVHPVKREYSNKGRDLPMSISPKSTTSARTLFGIQKGNTSTETLLKNLHTTYVQPNSTKSLEEKQATLKQGLKDILAVKTNGRSKNHKDQVIAENKLRQEINKLKDPTFKSTAIQILDELTDTSTNDSTPGRAIAPSSYAYDSAQLAALNIAETRNLKEAHAEALPLQHTQNDDKGISLKRSNSDLTQNDVEITTPRHVIDLNDLEDIDDTSTVNAPIEPSLQSHLAELIPEFKLGKTAQDLKSNIHLLIEFAEDLEDDFPDTTFSNTQVISEFLFLVDQAIKEDPSQAQPLTATKEAFRDAFIERYGLLSPNESAMAPSLAAAPRGTSIMTDKKTAFDSKLGYLADTGSGLAMLHAFGGAHGNFSIENTVVHNGNGLLTGFSLETAPIDLASLGEKYPAPEALYAKETGRTDKLNLQKLDVFAFGIEVLHATIDKTILNVPGVISNSDHKFPESPSPKSVSRFLTQTRRLEEGLSRTGERPHLSIRKELATLIHDCTSTNPRDRITMEDAVTRLQQLITDNPERPSMLEG